MIELMIVVAIIGLLAAIAAPNYIAYRNKAFCSMAESDANTIAQEISAYFAVPSHTTIDKTCISSTTTNNHIWNITPLNPDLSITITVHDDSGRCPPSYQKASPLWDGNVYTKVMHI